MAKGHDGKINHRYSWVVISVDSVNDPLIRRTESRIIARVTSYEMVCATARRAPIRAYFEFEAHPEDRKSTRLNSSHANISYAVFCLKKKKKINNSSTIV